MSRATTAEGVRVQTALKPLSLAMDAVITMLPTVDSLRQVQAQAIPALWRRYPFIDCSTVDVRKREFNNRQALKTKALWPLTHLSPWVWRGRLAAALTFMAWRIPKSVRQPAPVRHHATKAYRIAAMRCKVRAAKTANN